MIDLLNSLDILMCLMWIVTYTLVLVGTKLYRYPTISPITQAIIAPFEFAVVINYIVNGSSLSLPLFAVYLYWTVIEILIITAIINLGFIKRVYGYLMLILGITAIMIYLVVIKNQMYFFSYFNTFVGEIIWFAYIFKKDYPIKPLVLLSFITKFIGDAVSIPVYLNSGTVISKIICIVLPILDFAFIIAYFVKKNKLLSSCAKEEV